MQTGGQGEHWYPVVYPAELVRTRPCTRPRRPRIPATVDATLDLLTAHDYVADRRLATAVFLALKLQRPLFLEGEAGVGKTEIAKVLAAGLGRPLVRLQCYEGLDTASAVYEWNYPRQMIEIRLAEAAGTVARDGLSRDIFAPRFLLKRPLLQAIDPDDGIAPVLLIDELDRTDEPFEAYLLEVLSDFQVSIPELGPIVAEDPAHRRSSRRTARARSTTRSSAAASTTGSTIPMRCASSSILRRKCPARAGDRWRARSSRSRSGCARWTCSRRRASPKRWTGPRRC